MRTKLLVTIASFVALVVILGYYGLIVYAQASCGQYRIFEPACSELLSDEETQRLLQSRQSAVEELLQVNSGMVNVYAQPQSRCSDKSIIVISHPSERDCDSLKKILRKNFSDIPYRIDNN